MKYTDYKAVLVLADELNKNKGKLEHIMQELEREELRCRDGIRDFGGEVVTQFVEDVKKDITLTSEKLELISRQLVEYAEKLIQLMQEYMKLQGLNTQKK